MTPGEPKPLNLLLRAEGGVIKGGLLGATRWHWLLVHMLWIEDDWRGQGFGRALLERAEAIARGRGCERVSLDTTDFQALGFYERAGYRVFGELVDLPPGSRTFYLEKTLTILPESDR
jgi:GNAT superfamily N-acetyltransferase